MIAAIEQSARRVAELVRHAYVLLEAGADPAGDDPWIGISLATLVVQATALGGASGGVRPEVPEFGTVKDCLFAVLSELAAWDWDVLDGDDLRAGCQLVLDVADLVGAL